MLCGNCFANDRIQFVWADTVSAVQGARAHSRTVRIDEPRMSSYRCIGTEPIPTCSTILCFLSLYARVAFFVSQIALCMYEYNIILFLAPFHANWLSPNIYSRWKVKCQLFYYSPIAVGVVRLRWWHETNAFPICTEWEPCVRVFDHASVCRCVSASCMCEHDMVFSARAQTPNSVSTIILWIIGRYMQSSSWTTYRTLKMESAECSTCSCETVNANASGEFSKSHSDY